MAHRRSAATDGSALNHDVSPPLNVNEKTRVKSAGDGEHDSDGTAEAVCVIVGEHVVDLLGVVVGVDVTETERSGDGVGDWGIERVCDCVFVPVADGVRDFVADAVCDGERVASWVAVGELEGGPSGRANTRELKDDPPVKVHWIATRSKRCRRTGTPLGGIYLSHACCQRNRCRDLTDAHSHLSPLGPRNLELTPSPSSLPAAPVTSIVLLSLAWTREMSGRSTSISLDGVQVLASRAFSDEGKGVHWTDDPTVELPVKIGTGPAGSMAPVTIPFAFSQAVERNHNLPALRVVRKKHLLPVRCAASGHSLALAEAWREVD